MKKRSFFDRLSGSQTSPDDYDSFDDDLSQGYGVRRAPAQQAYEQSAPASAAAAPYEAEDPEGQLPVDVYQTPNEIVIRAFIAGVRPDDINLSISRDMVVIDGSREERTTVTEEDYFRRELFWGSFSTTILLPEEIDVDASTANAKDGLLSIVLPKLDKARQTKLKVKAG
jgi:HSP20 family molecular chaperone IbpA